MSYKNASYTNHFLCYRTSFKEVCAVSHTRKFSRYFDIINKNPLFINLIYTPVYTNRGLFIGLLKHKIKYCFKCSL